MVNTAPYLVALSLVVTHGLSPTMIAGRRCLLNPSENSKKTPLILVGGTAQTISSWVPHVDTLSKQHRPFLVYECVGQGQAPADLTDVSFPLQVTQMDNVIRSAFPDSKQVDLIGFSLGGRICMAYCVQFPESVRKLHLTGVAAGSTPAGLVALASWKDMLRNGNLQGFGWSILQTTFSPTFLHKNINRLPLWVKDIANSNSAEGLIAILEQTRDREDWEPLAMAKRMNGICGCLVVGEYDLIAPYNEAQLLTNALGWSAPTVIRDFITLVGLSHGLHKNETNATELLKFVIGIALIDNLYYGL